jgi:hypothetical protein
MTDHIAVTKHQSTEVCTMIIATVLGLLALFSFVSILLSDEDELPEVDPRDRLPTWARFGLR